MKQSIYKSVIAGMTLLVAGSAWALDLPTRVINGVKYYIYVVKKGETLYHVSHELGIDRDVIVAENPGASDGLRTGQQLYFPYDNFADKIESSDNSVIQPIVEQPHHPTPPAVEIIEVGTTDTTVYMPEPEQEAVAGVNQKQEREIAIFMPFMLDEHNPGKPADAALEFYRGFLLGVDSLNQMTPLNKLKVSVYDTEGKMLTLKKTLASNDALQSVDLIITPDNADQTELLGKWGKKYNVQVLNLFDARDTTYLSNPMMLNANIPSATMLEKAAEYYASTTRGFKPVILKHKDGAHEKQAFIDMLTAQWKKQGVIPGIIEYSDRLTEQTLSKELEHMPAGTNFVFISPTASYTDFAKYAMALPAFRDNIAEGGGQIMLLGYPEWTTFRSDALKTMFEDNTLIYTRFYADQNSFDVQNINNSFAKWYGQRMAEGVPSLGLLGYDTAGFVLRLINAQGYTPSYSGIQTRFDFKKVNEESGLVNDALQIVHFMPGEIIDITAL